MPIVVPASNAAEEIGTVEAGVGIVPAHAVQVCGVGFVAKALANAQDAYVRIGPVHGWVAIVIKPHGVGTGSVLFLVSVGDHVGAAADKRDRIGQRETGIVHCDLDAVLRTGELEDCVFCHRNIPGLGECDCGSEVVPLTVRRGGGFSIPIH